MIIVLHNSVLQMLSSHWYGVREYLCTTLKFPEPIYNLSTELPIFYNKNVPIMIFYDYKFVINKLNVKQFIQSNLSTYNVTS